MTFSAWVSPGKAVFLVEDEEPGLTGPGGQTRQEWKKTLDTVENIIQV
jgi:hypothetical protein